MSNSIKILQTTFTSSLRQSEQLADTSRINLYHNLVFSSFNDLIKPCFPVLKSILSVSLWEELIRDFIQKHPVSTPLFYQIPGEFVRFLQESANLSRHPPFLADLAHYEWMELVIELAVEEQIPVIKVPPLRSVFRFSSTAAMRHYHYPVEQISQNYLPQQPEDSFLIIWRDANDKVEFMKISAFVYHLLNHMTESKTSASSTLDLENHPQREELTPLCERLLNDLIDKNILFPAR
ncbi:hypothetical protein Lqui_2082 [Legionella quinlivanii]|uniref:Uncharacterized protein n=1 Tax=Legionella quinlivanii TaxID=45073 RepID=A0A0W0XUR1_9GAMM|nr:putative DNA-binding domain-containing protein [Legionella quinlivanii]KTD48166.1 hypothetical protein Lqui_2082 [Legionella quinlivanii]MCW8451678.1 putative DNA-binding domain-containing protein [Legionella quinlivanii]SEG47349.1 hypothetical protein SAMN02746093_03074 [Legionella quinlivanii DSM 21216]STY10067.1 Uncharacterized protein conserved in bacteria [Legionella quinlivanii]